VVATALAHGDVRLAAFEPARIADSESGQPAAQGRM